MEQRLKEHAVWDVLTSHKPLWALPYYERQSKQQSHIHKIAVIEHVSTRVSGTPIRRDISAVA